MRSRLKWRGGSLPSVRWLLIHMSSRDDSTCAQNIELQSIRRGVLCAGTLFMCFTSIDFFNSQQPPRKVDDIIIPSLHMKNETQTD